MSVPSNLVPTRILQLPEDPSPSDLGWMMYVNNGVTYKVQVNAVLNVSGVPTTRVVAAGTGLTGGGALSSNITISVAPGGIGASQLDLTGVTPGVYGDSTHFPVFTVDENGRLTTATEIEIPSVSGYVPTSRQVIAGTGLSGGGALTTNVTLDANLSNLDPLAVGTTEAGTSNEMSRADHVHPAIDLTDTTQTTGALDISRGGTGSTLISPAAGGIVYSNGGQLDVSNPGVAGQVVVSTGTGAPTWGNALVISDQAANLVYAGPASGGPGPTSFRTLVNADLQYNSITINGNAVSLGGSTTVTATATNALTIGTGLTGTSYNGSTPVTIAINSTVATLTGVQTLTNKTLSSPLVTGSLEINGPGVTGYTPFTDSLVSMAVDFNGYREVYGVNMNNGSDASFDFVAYNDASDVNSYFVDMGMNSSNYSSLVYPIFTANSGYLFTGGGSSGQAADLFIGTSNANSDLNLFTGDVLTSSIRATLKGNTGNFLLGTTTDTGYTFNNAGTIYQGGAATFGSTVLLNAAPTLALQAATKQYVDDAVSAGIVVHPSVLVEAIGNLNATYYNGAAGVGATLTNAGTQAALVLDGITLAVNDRVLVMDQTTQSQNGVYYVSNTGSIITNWVLTRATDADTYGVSNPNKLAQGSYFYIRSGDTAAGESYICTTVGTITFGTTAITFSQFSASAQYTGGTNINVSGQIISLSGTVAATNGGTGTSTVTTGDLLYGSATDTWSKLAKGVGYKSLVMDASGTNIEWNAVALNQSTAVSGQLSVSNGGTGQSSFTDGQLLIGNSTGNTLAKSTLTAGTGISITNGNGTITIAANISGGTF